MTEYDVIDKLKEIAGRVFDLDDSENINFKELVDLAKIAQAEEKLGY